MTVIICIDDNNSSFVHMAVAIFELRKDFPIDQEKVK